MYFPTLQPSWSRLWLISQFVCSISGLVCPLYGAAFAWACLHLWTSVLLPLSLEMRGLNLLVQALYLWFLYHFPLPLCSIAAWPGVSLERWVYHVSSLQLVFAVRSSMNTKWATMQRCARTVILPYLCETFWWQHCQEILTPSICGYHTIFGGVQWTHHSAPSSFTVSFWLALGGIAVTAGPASRAPRLSISEL